MKDKFFIVAAVGFVGGVAACWKHIEKHGYFAPDVLKRRFARFVVGKTYGPEYTVAHKCVLENRYRDYVPYSKPEKPVNDMKNEKFELVRIFGKDALMSIDRLALRDAMSSAMVNAGCGGASYYEYDLRESEGGSDIPATVEVYPVRVNYFSSICTLEPLNFADGTDHIELHKGDLQYCDVILSAESFVKAGRNR